MQQIYRLGFCLFLTTACALTLATSAKKYRLVWNDEFEGSEVDVSKWSFLLGDGCNYNLCGWGNNEMQSYTDTKDNAFVANGRLVIQAKRDFIRGPCYNRTYSSARLVSKGKGDFKFGKIEVRAKFCHGKGVWPLIIMLPSFEKYGPWPNSGELDIAVMPDPRTLYVQVIYGRSYKDFSNPKKAPAAKGSYFTEDFHNFVVEWKKDRVIWRIDDVVVHKFSKAQVMSIDNYPFNEKFHFVLSVSVGGNVVGNPSATLFPRRLEVDYIRVFQYI